MLECSSYTERDETKHNHEKLVTDPGPTRLDPKSCSIPTVFLDSKTPVI